MQQHEIIQKLEALIPEVKASGDTEGTLLKFARQNNLAPAQLEKLAQVYNTAKTLTFLDKSEDRGGTFSVIDASDLARRYMTDQPKSANVLDDFLGLGESGMAKAASSGTAEISWFETSEKSAAHNPDRFPDLLEPCGGLVSDQINDLVKSAREVIHELSNSWENNDRFQTLKSDAIEDTRECFAKIAEAVKYKDIEFTHLAEDARAAYGDEIKPCLEKLARYLNGVHIEVTRENDIIEPGLYNDRTGFLELLKQASDKLEFHKAACAFEESDSFFFKKKATQLKDPEALKVMTEYLNADRAFQVASGSQSRSKPDVAGAMEFLNKRDNEKQRQDQETQAKRELKALQSFNFDTLGTSPKREEGPSVVENAYKSMANIPAEIGSAASGLSKTLSSLRDIPSSIGHKNPQKTVDEAVLDAQFMSNLQRFIVSDPIISEAEHEDIIDYANTIRQFAPDIAQDKNAMRFLLREAIQYGSVPIHTLKDLTSSRKELAQARKDETLLNKDRYAT